MIKTKESDSRATPEWVKEFFKGWFDPCPLNYNPEIDGLAIEWKDKTFVNPPYSQVKKWVFKAIEENKKGKRITLLIRYDLSTSYWKELLQLNPHILFFGERLRFINPDGTSYASPFPSVLVILENSHNTSTNNEETKK